jgi:hypothetical protein
MPAQMTVNEVYQLMQYTLNKNQQGYLSPQQFSLVINQAQFSYFNYLLGEFQKYQPGRPIAPVEWGQSAQLRERLTPFIQPPSALNVDPATGNAPYPTDYEYWDAMYYGIYKKPVKFIQQDRLASHLNSYIRPIATNPVFLSIYTGFTVYPTDIGTTELSYIRTPKSINWSYTTDIYGRPVYSPIGSVDPEWRREDMLQIISRALSIVGVNLQAPAVAQYAENIKNLGQ